MNICQKLKIHFLLQAFRSLGHARRVIIIPLAARPFFGLETSHHLEVPEFVFV
jgi:hypothetical protein